MTVGDKAAIGCMVGGCDKCDDCTKGLESYCRDTILTYNYIYHDGTRTYGGYSDWIVAEEHCGEVPGYIAHGLWCATSMCWITVYSPLKYYGLNEPGKHLGVVGLGGLGHLAVKFAKAFGVKVTVISTSPQGEGSH
ncbi:8-hydroxygeraniol dehydrogenase-like [Iris pallida]|uniref:8-hydroxygeraniol dehydrogenase-like n=1 Tax=Iris pallida TaxID=29817 RepID=A0AAX6F3N7_IRIPA|nr:8-hydroxygeraniol dehydrogenase-like [Iris pallida]